MPHPGTHITIIQRLALADAKFAAVLGSPDPNLGQTNAAAVRRMRFASLGAVGPDLFYFMADYSSLLQDFEERIVKLAGTLQAFEDVGEALGKVQDKLGKETAILSCGLSSIVQELVGSNGVGGAATLLFGAFTNLLGDQAIEAGFNPWSVFELRRQQDKPRQKWFWADYLHYVRTGDFASKLLEKSRFDPKYKGHPNLFAYALGYMTHYVTDAVGHPYVNQLVQAPYRLYWQRHALVENFIDAYVWGRWHVNPAGNDPDTGQVVKDPVTGKKPLDKVVAPPGNSFANGAPLQYARLHELVDCGSVQGFDPVDKYFKDAAGFVSGAVASLAGLSDIELEDDEELVLWTQLMAESIEEVYGGIVHPENLGAGPAGLPTAENIQSAYGVARFFLKLMSDEKVREPKFPNIAQDIGNELKDLWDDLKKDLGAIPSPPSIDTGGSFNLKSFWHELKAWAQFVAETAAAVAKAAIDLVRNLCQTAGTVGRDVVKMSTYLVHKALWTIHQALRETLVFAAYAQPTFDHVNEFKSLWLTPGNMAAGTYPVEEYFHDGELPQTELWSDYEPLTPPSTLAGAVAELPTVHWAAPYKKGAAPDAFIDGTLGKTDMFGLPDDKGPVGPLQVETSKRLQPDEIPVQTFTEEELDYGGAMANCTRVLEAILKQAGKEGKILPPGMQLPNYNLDGDRGYGWPCWDVAGPQVKLRPGPVPPHQATVHAVPLNG